MFAMQVLRRTSQGEKTAWAYGDLEEGLMKTFHTKN